MALIKSTLVAVAATAVLVSIMYMAASTSRGFTAEPDDQLPLYEWLYERYNGDMEARIVTLESGESPAGFDYGFWVAVSVVAGFLGPFLISEVIREGRAAVGETDGRK